MSDEVTTMAENAVRAMIPAEPRILDREKGIVEYVASSETISATGHLILVDGWDFSRMRKNNPFLDVHRQGSVTDVLGRVLGARTKNDEVIETVQWAIETPSEKIKIGWSLTVGGYLKGVSMGFLPLEIYYRYPKGDRKKPDPNFEEKVKSYGVSEEQVKAVQYLCVRQQQTELSAAPVPANPDCILQAFEDGCLQERELASIGFGDEDAFEFLQQAAAAYRSPECDEVMQALIEREMRRTTSQATQENVAGVAGVVSEERQAMRQQFLEELRAITAASSGQVSGGGDSKRAQRRAEFIKQMQSI